MVWYNLLQRLSDVRLLLLCCITGGQVRLLSDVRVPPMPLYQISNLPTSPICQYITTPQPGAAWYANSAHPHVICPTCHPDFESHKKGSETFGLTHDADLEGEADDDAVGK